jgi:hypothetical protein
MSFGSNAEMKRSNISYRIDPSANLIEGYAEGILNFEDFDLHMKELSVDPDFYSGIAGLYDFSKVIKIKGDPSFFENTSDQINDEKLIRDQAKVAIVTGGNEQLEGVFSGWKVMMSLTLLTYETFITKEDAQHWLTLPN